MSVTLTKSGDLTNAQIPNMQADDVPCLGERMGVRRTHGKTASDCDNGDLLDRVADIGELFARTRREFFEGLVLVSLPVRIVEIFVKHDDGTRRNAIAERVKNRRG